MSINLTSAGFSCSFCHLEHPCKIWTKKNEPQDANCNFCHGDAAKMAVLHGNPGGVHHFADDHPQFRFLTEKLADPDSLKFNHADCT